jgi:pimeloyl-ACP methyl ester carboxylesterase
MVGHSMGTAVAMELCLLAPAAVRSLVLLNGLHGKVFHTAFQASHQSGQSGSMCRTGNGGSPQIF